MFKQKTNVLLVVPILMVAMTALAQPQAKSYKATANITSLGPGTADCPAGQLPVSVSGNGFDYAGPYALTEEICAEPIPGVPVPIFLFSGHFEIRHTNRGFWGSYSGPFNGTFFPSDQVFEVHATWRITEGDGAFLSLTGAGTAKGVAMKVDTPNGPGPGPGAIVLDGSILTPGN